VSAALDVTGIKRLPLAQFLLFSRKNRDYREREDAAMVTPCDACGEDAEIQKTRYTYRVQGPPGHPNNEHVLRETHCDVQCPNCGPRTVVELHSHSGE
jgi:ssDNA-binding Zn-finger/Zn-ribbon topoisomerase 1